MQIFQLDVCSAFLCGKIRENVYVTLPEDFNQPKDLFINLKNHYIDWKAQRIGIENLIDRKFDAVVRIC